MSIKAELDAELKEAMRARDQARLDVIRQINTEVSREVKAAAFQGEADDALYRRVIAAYAKKMRKALEEYEGYGERGAEAAAKLRFEVEYLQRWLPRGPSEQEIERLVAAAIEQLGVTDPKQAGRVTGHVMKNTPGLDGGTVNAIARRLLGSD